MTLDKLLAASQEQMERFPKYKQKLTDVNRRFHGPRFVDDPDFDLRNHVKAIRLKEPAGKVELEAVVSRFVAEPFDLDKPLWGSIFVENYQGEDGADSAMITRGCADCLSLFLTRSQSSHARRRTGLRHLAVVHHLTPS